MHNDNTLTADYSNFNNLTFNIFFTYVENTSISDEEPFPRLCNRDLPQNPTGTSVY